MGLVYITDTNMVSELMRPQPNETVLAHWQQVAGQVALTSVIWHELLAGVYRLPDSKRRRGMERFLEDTVRPAIPILPYDQGAAEWHAEERARLSQLGRMPYFADGQIAAVAATNDLILVTRNLADFADFADLAVENWFGE
jgi:tRNA(fMet)-specific endonuclease VapC